MPRAKKDQQKVPTQKKTRGLCPSRCYYSMVIPHLGDDLRVSVPQPGGGGWGGGEGGARLLAGGGGGLLQRGDAALASWWTTTTLGRVVDPEHLHPMMRIRDPVAQIKIMRKKTISLSREQMKFFIKKSVFTWKNCSFIRWRGSINQLKCHVF